MWHSQNPAILTRIVIRPHPLHPSHSPKVARATGHLFRDRPRPSRGEVGRRPGHRPGTRRVVTAVGEGGPPRGATKADDVPGAAGLDQGQLFTSPRQVSESANLAPVCAKSARTGLDQSASRGLLFGHGSTAGNTRGTLAQSASFDVALFAFRPEWGSNITAQGIALGRRSRTCRMP